MVEVLIAGAKALSVCAGVAALAWGAWAVVTDRPLNPERSPEGGDD